jgi:ribosome biogenesis GTPase
LSDSSRDAPRAAPLPVPRFVARVVGDFGRRFIVAAENGAAPLAAVRRGKRDDVVIGDQVECSGDEHGAVIESIAPRDRLLFRSVATRTQLLAANIDQLAIVYAAQPPPNPHFVWRALVAAAAAGIDALLVQNKIELDDPEQRAAALLARADGLGVATTRISVKGAPEAARAALLDRLGGRVTLLAGQSGMGKSSVVNLLLPGARERTQEFSVRLNIGRQTTTASRWFDLPGGGALIDAPGFQRFGLAHIGAKDLAALLPDFAPLTAHCRFGNCLHLTEPGCAVRAAVDAGTIDRERYGFYRDLVAELQA